MPPINVQSLVADSPFLARWMEYAKPLESPDSYMLCALLAAAACAINGRIVVNPNSKPSCHTNMFVVLYGPSGARKSSAIEEATRLLKYAVPDAPVLPTSFTVEGLISYLAEVSAKVGKGSGLIVAHELSDLIGGPEYRAANSKFLTDIWDCRLYPRRTVSHGYEEIVNPYINMLAASAPDWLETTDPKTLAGGFLRRLLMVVEYGPKHRNARPELDAVLFRALAQIMAERLGPGAFGGAMMVLEPAAISAFEAWYKGSVARIWNAAGEREGHFASCMQAHALKVGATINLLEGRGADMLRVESLVTAMTLIEALVPSMFMAYRSLVPTAFARLQALILRTLESHGGSIEPERLDKTVGDAAGVPPNAIWNARESLIRKGYLIRDKEGRITLT